MKDATGAPTSKKKKPGLNLLRLAVFILRIKSPTEKLTKETSPRSLPASSSSSPPPPQKSGYSSAAELRQLSDEDSEDESDFDRRNQHSIDIRAEDFIARFYEQVRLQKSDSVNSGATSS